MIQQPSPINKVMNSEDEMSKKKLAVINNFLENISDSTFDTIYSKIQKNPKALAKVQTYINFL